MLSRRSFIGATALTALAAPFARPAAAQGRPGFFRARDIAAAGYVYGLPIVMNYGVMYEFTIDKTSSQYKAPFNTLYNDGRVFTWQDTAIVTPNSDTPYSMVWADLRAEPLILSVPPIDPKRYYSVQMVDGNTYNYGYVGSRTTGNGGGTYMIVGPHWTGTLPPGVDRSFRASTDFGLTIFRTQLFDAADIDNVRAIQARYKVETLSSFLGTAPPAAPAAVAFPVFDKAKVAENFFAYLDFALRFAPATPEETWIRAELARIGVGPGRSFDFSALSLEDKAEILLGLEDGKRQVEAAIKSIGTDINGWRIAAAFGDAGFFSGNWMLRACAAQLGIYGNDAAEAMYPATRQDSDGDTLDGSSHRYTVTFPAGQLPPVNAFWSITLYDGKTQLLIKNPINRYLINSPMLSGMKYNADGSLTIYIQRDNPGADKQANWLPAPDGPIYLVMRLYWPGTGPLSILPPGRGTWKPPAILKA